MSDTKKRPYVRTLRAYVVTSEDEDRIVRAHTPAEALKHCTPTFSVRAATHDDIIELMAAGVAVETVGGCIPEAIPAHHPDAPGLTD
jgi:hypothetical protein